MKREEAIERIKTEKALICGGCIHPQAIGYCENTCKLPEALDMAIEALTNISHGEWIETTSGTICNNCGKYPYDDGEYHIANWHSDFCPSCGADMRQKK